MQQVAENLEKLTISEPTSNEEAVINASHSPSLAGSEQ